MYPEIKYLGTIVRWLLCGCKTKLRDEFNEPRQTRWKGVSFELVDYLIGGIIITFFLMIVVYFVTR